MISQVSYLTQQANHPNLTTVSRQRMKSPAKVKSHLIHSHKNPKKGGYITDNTRRPPHQSLAHFHTPVGSLSHISSMSNQKPSHLNRPQPYYQNDDYNFEQAMLLYQIQTEQQNRHDSRFNQPEIQHTGPVSLKHFEHSQSPLIPKPNRSKTDNQPFGDQRAQRAKRRPRNTHGGMRRDHRRASESGNTHSKHLGQWNTAKQNKQPFVGEQRLLIGANQEDLPRLDKPPSRGSNKEENRIVSGLRIDSLHQDEDFELSIHENEAISLRSNGSEQNH